MLADSYYQFDFFDSLILGRGVAKMRLSYKNFSSFEMGRQEFDYFCQTHDVTTIFCYVPIYAPFLRSLERENFYLVSTIAKYRAKLNSFDFMLDDCSFIVDMSQMAFESFKMDQEIFVKALSRVSHYALDENLGVSFAEEIYRRWLSNTFGGYADKVFVYVEHDAVVGFISLKHKGGELSIDLLCVHPDYKGKGIASLLVKAAIVYARSARSDLLVSTQLENIAANRVYQKEGFVVEDNWLVYHKLI